MRFRYLFIGSFFLIVCLSLFSRKLKSQDRLIKFKDSQTQKSLPFVGIYLKKQKLFYTASKEGLFLLTNQTKENNDTIIFNCIGYHSQEFSLDKLTNLHEIMLHQKSIELPEVRVRPDHSKTFRTEKPKAKGSIGGIPKEQFMVGLCFDSTLCSNKKIVSVEFYIHKGGDLNTPFSIHFFKLTNGRPSQEEFYHQNFIVRPYKYGWNRFEIPSKDLYVPESGCFIAMEWLDFQSIDYEKIDYTKKDYNLDFKKYRGHYLGMGSYSKSQINSLGFYKTIQSKNNQWKSTDLLFNNFQQPAFKNQILNPLIALKLN